MVRCVSQPPMKGNTELAKATAKTVTKVEGVTLELSEGEARAVMALVGKVSGADIETESVYQALKGAGVSSGFTVYMRDYETRSYKYAPTLRVSENHPG